MTNNLAEPWSIFCFSVFLFCSEWLSMATNGYEAKTRSF